MNLTSLGVDVSVARGLDLVLLSAEKNIVDSRARQSPAELGAYLAERRPTVVAIDSPPSFGTSGGMRLAERKLMRQGIRIYGTPSAGVERSFYDWMRVGHEAFRVAAVYGYPLYRGGTEVAGTAIEVFPHASAVVLQDCLPPQGYSKRVWRADALNRHGVNCDSLQSLDQIDAALAALTGLVATRGVFCPVGDQADGFILLPCSGLRERYLRGSEPPAGDLNRVLEIAIALALNAHAGQTDKGNSAYIRHPLRVMERVSGEGLEAMIAAVLHDVVEDSALSFDDLFSKGIPRTVVDALRLVTKRPEEEGSDAGYDAFIRRIAVSGSRLAVAVKLADLADNSDLSRLTQPTQKDRDRAAKYDRARQILLEVFR